METNGTFNSSTVLSEEEEINPIVSRIRNLSSLLYKIRTFYSDSLGQLLVLKLPDVTCIGRDPENECNLEDLETLLLLLLGSAVQCESKQRFIEAIKSLDLEVQLSIVEFIQQITENPSSVWINSEWGELSLIQEVDQPRMYSTLVSNVNRLAKERDELSQRVVELVLELENLKSKEPSHSHRHHSHHHHHHLNHLNQSSLPSSPSSSTGSGNLLASSPHLNGPDGSSPSSSTNSTPNHQPSSSLYKSYSSSSVSSLLTLTAGETSSTHKSQLINELAEVKSKYRSVIVELEEKSELVNDLKENLEQSKETCNKLRSENLELIQEARSAKAYRDEIDVLTERVRKVDRLEKEVAKYREKINELDFYKSRVEEMREDNRILGETKTMLEEQLDSFRKKAELIPDLESQIISLRAYSNEVQFQRDLDREKIDSLMEEITSLQVEKKTIIEELTQVQKELNDLKSQYTAIKPIVSPISSGLENNLFEQLNNDAAKRVLKLELENQKLHSLIESIRNNNKETSLLSDSPTPFNHHHQHFIRSSSQSSSMNLGSPMKNGSLRSDEITSSGSDLNSHNLYPTSSLPPSPPSTVESGTLLASSSPTPVGPDGPSTTPNPSHSLYKSYSSSSVSSLNNNNNTLNHSNNINNESSSHLVNELAETKSKYCKLAEQLEERSLLVNELKDDLVETKQTCDQLRSENLDLAEEAEAMKRENERLKDRVRLVDRLETEVQNYREKIADLMACKTRLEEMNSQNDSLLESKGFLEEQLDNCKRKIDQIPKLEAEILSLRAYSNEMQFQRDRDRDKITSLMEEVNSLEREKKTIIEELSQVQKELNSLRCQYTAVKPVVSPISLENDSFAASQHNLTTEPGNGGSGGGSVVGKRVINIEPDSNHHHHSPHSKIHPSTATDNLRNSKETPPKSSSTCNFIRTSLRSTINISSPLKRNSNFHRDDSPGLVSISPVLHRHHHHGTAGDYGTPNVINGIHHHHYLHHHHAHHTHPLRASVGVGVAGLDSDEMVHHHQNNHHQEVTDGVNNSNHSLNNSTWYEYGCV